MTKDENTERRKDGKTKRQKDKKKIRENDRIPIKKIYLGEERATQQQVRLSMRNCFF